MKRRWKLIVVAVMTLSAFVLTACSKSDNGAKMMDTVSKSEVTSSYDMDDGVAGEEMMLTSTSSFTATSSNETPMDKIITNVNLDVETKEFDALIETIKDEISRLGGYDERTEVRGNRYNSRGNRHAYIVARIPKDRLDDFVNLVNDNANVISETSSKENVTLKYVDTESRKKTLEIEQERLFSFLEKTETLEDIITLESRLSSIRYELQMYETELRTMDNKVDYSTVTMSINEVERITPTLEKETVFTRIKDGFGNTIYNISEGAKNFFVWFVVNLPYLIIWAVIIIVGIKIFKVIKRKSIKKDLASKAQDLLIESDQVDETTNKVKSEK